MSDFMEKASFVPDYEEDMEEDTKPTLSYWEQSLYVEDTTQTTSDFTDGERELLALFEDCNGITKSPTYVCGIACPLENHQTSISDFDVLEATYGEREFQLDVAIANYVFPDHWECFREQANDPRIYLTFGIHPHVTSMEYSTVRLHELLREPGCVGLGEVGLDFTYSCRCNPRCRSSKACKREKLAHQRAFLRKVLPIAKEMDLTLVVHCRDPNTGCAAKEFLSILEDLHFTDLRIHRHCFTGNAVEAMTWMHRLPNVKFGFTSNLLRLSGAADVICAIPMSNVLLESDAPYLTPTSRMNIYTPWALFPVARRIAELKGVALSDVLAQTLHNLKCLYRI
ncbi:uncharacterized metal-dependent hydrolase YabD [Magallana gigas]|uniref:uncharacterized metal-dependent hydrolase YabD n=1 Tax=Magallana gigas TaxID=29159 RepID=UPI0033406B9D